MKKLSFLLLVITIITCSSVMAQQHKLVKMWETDSLLKVPESVYFDGADRVLYTSNIDGQPGEKDGKGSVGKVGLDGKIVKVDWVSGLNAPKGMGRYKNNLYVADLDAVGVIDLKTGKLLRRIPVEGAVFLNDITIDPKGVVYVSDSRGKKVYRIENDKPSVYLDNLQGPNGLLFQGGSLYILDSGTMLKVESNKSLTKVVDGMGADTDGIEHVQGKDFLVSCWGGAIYYVSGNSKEQLLDTREKKINSADIGYDAKNRIVYVPTFFKNSIVAYKVQ